MSEQSPSQEADVRGPAAFNAAIAAVLVALAAWITVADFAHSGKLLFQTSSSLLVTVLFLGLLLFLSFIFAALPKRIVIGANLLMLSRFSFGFPLNVWLDHSVASRTVSVLLLILSLTYLAMSLRQVSFMAGRPWLNLRHSLVAIISGLLVAGLSVPMVGLGFVYGAADLVGHYGTLSPRGLGLVERVFQKDGQRVHLVGMMHVGHGSFYQELARRMSAPPREGERRLVLTEGVSDRAGIIPPDFANGKVYERWAKFLGLEAQKSLEPGKAGKPDDPAPRPDGPGNAAVVWQNADMDVSDLEARHRDLLVRLLDLVSTASPTEMLTADMGDVTGEQIEDLLENGLVGSRNQALMARFDQMAAGFAEVYIPWGAAHLPDVEAQLLSRGYSLSSETTREVVKFWE